MILRTRIYHKKRKIRNSLMNGFMLNEHFLGEKLIKQLTKSFDSRKLAKLLPETKKSIERLKDVDMAAKKATAGQKAFLNPVVFFLTDSQKSTVDEAIASAIDPGQTGTTAQKRAWAIVKILREAKLR